MKLEVLTFCYSATVGGMGQLNILGSTDHLFSLHPPITMDRCTLVAKVRFDKGEEGMKSFVFRFVDMDGHPVVPIKTPNPFEVQIPPAATSVSAGSVLNIQPLILPSFGEYRIDLLVNEISVGSIPVFAHRFEFPQQMSQPQPPPPPQQSV